MAVIASSAKAKGKGRKGQRAEGRRAGAIVTPHVYGFKRYVWGETFRFGYDEATANARCLRLLALKATLEGQGATAWTAETKAKAWDIAKGKDEALAAPNAQTVASSPSNAASSPSAESVALGYADSPSTAEDAPATKTATLYAALDAYVGQLQTADHSFAGRVKAQRKAIANLPLEQLGERELRHLVRYWKNKPKAFKTIWVEEQGVKVYKVVETDNRLGALSIKKNIQAARQFFNWLASADSGYAWKAPLNLAVIFRLTNVDFNNLKSDAERIAEVKAMNDPNALHFKYEELEALWDACGISKLRKAYFLLALNIGAATSEIGHLRLGDCYLEGDNAAKPFVAFIRNKTKRHRCYGKWFLWAETANVLRAAIAQRKAEGKTKDTDFVFLTEEGNPLVTKSPGGNRNDSVKLVWRGWKKMAKLERLSWKNLRKTSSQRVREAATALGQSGEYMSELHIAHKQGGMSAAYNRRSESEWEQLGRVLAEVRKGLKFLDKQERTVISSKAE